MNTSATWILWLKIFGLIGLILGLFAYLTTVTIIFVPFILAIVLNVALAPVVSALERKDYERGNAVLIVFACFAAVLAVSMLVLPDFIAAEARVIEARWPQAKIQMMELLHDAEVFINGLVPPDNKVDLVTEVPAKLKHLGEEVIASLPHILAEGTVAMLLVPLFTFFLLRDGRNFKKGLVAAIPNRYFEMSLSILYKVNQQVGNYLRGLMMEASIDAIIASILCVAFGVPNPFIIGIIAGATTIMPLAGMVISIAICPLVAIFSAPAGSALTIVMFVAVAIVLTHIIDNVVVAPLIMGHSVHMHPVAVIVSILLAGKLFGVLGIILAVPVVSIMTAVLQEGYRGIKSNEYFLKNA